MSDVEYLLQKSPCPPASAGQGNTTLATVSAASSGSTGYKPAGNEATSTTLISPLRSAETFEAYCEQILSRLAEHAAQRMHFLQTAHDRLTRLLQTARDVGDTALYQELWQHRVAARELLEAAARVAQAEVKNLALHSTASSQTAGNGRLSQECGPEGATASPGLQARYVSPDTSAPPRFGVQEPRMQPATPFPISSSQESPIVARLPRRPLRPMGDIEADAAKLAADLKEWNRRFPLKDSAGDLDGPNCLRLRALACRMRRLEEDAGDTEISSIRDVYDKIIALLDAAGDHEYTVALDYELEPRPTAYQWGELAERYEEMARAQEAFDWWHRHESELSVQEIEPLAEAIAAVQQRFNRLLFRIGARDPFQQTLFDALRVWAREAQCYLHSLRPKVPISELIERASLLEDAWDRAGEPVAALTQRQQSVENVLQLVSHPGFGSDTERDEEALRAAVLACRALRIPPSDRTLRDGLLPWGSMLEGDERFREFLREINLEWDRRQDAGKADEEGEEDQGGTLESLRTELEAVREVTRGQRCLILGGTCREENRRKIEEALQLRELVWPSTKPSDPLSKFDTEIRHSDIVALLTRFSRKEWKNAQDICTREGKKFVHLTSGYGVAQIIRHFYVQISPEGARTVGAGT